MATYTIELNRLLTSGIITESDLFASLNIDATESEKDEIKSLIINHFYFREIGQETPDRFLHYFNLALQTHSPEYNRLYKSFSSSLDPFLNEQYSTKTEAEQIGTKNGETTHEISTEEKAKQTYINTFTPTVFSRRSNCCCMLPSAIRQRRVNILA